MWNNKLKSKSEYLSSNSNIRFFNHPTGYFNSLKNYSKFRYIKSSNLGDNLRFHRKCSGSECSSAFFSKYADHSKDIVKILKNGYGKGDMLGSIDDFHISDPKDPNIEDFGNAKKHLEKGYTDTWHLKESAYNESKNRLQEIKEIIKKFQTRVNKIIDEKSNFKLFRDNPFEELLKDKYYYPDIGFEIFKDMRNNAVNQFEYPFSSHEGKHLTLVKFRNTVKTIFSYRLDYDTSAKDESEFKNLIEILRNDYELKD